MVHARWLVVMLMGCVGCATTIVPPGNNGRDLTPVMVADYGYHSTILFPKSDGGMMEYAYGDWRFFGHNDKSLGKALRALLASDQATLGRRYLDREASQSGLAEALGARAVVRFDVPRDKVEALERALDKRFSAHLDTLIYSPVHHLYFVKDDVHYGVGHNCNHFTAGVLESLGCRLEGMVMLSEFRVAETGPAPATALKAGEARQAGFASGAR